MLKTQHHFLLRCKYLYLLHPAVLTKVCSTKVMYRLLSIQYSMGGNQYSETQYFNNNIVKTLCNELIMCSISTLVKLIMAHNRQNMQLFVSCVPVY